MNGMPVRSRPACLGIAALALGWALSPRASGEAATARTRAETFIAVTRPLFDQTCSPCHGGADPAGGFDVSQYRSIESLSTRRDQWERVRERLRSGDMPPEGVERPEAAIRGLVSFLDAELGHAAEKQSPNQKPSSDPKQPPDPGRITLRRLNRTEYTNTIRDLLGLEFRADQNFPSDDSGDGFDNIGDVLTVSPLLMDKYLAAAERIAARAVGTVQLPPPFAVQHGLRLGNLRALDRRTVEGTHRCDFDGEYELRVGMPGVRPGNALPVMLAVWVDGKLLGRRRVETKAATKGPVVDPSSEESFRVALSEGEHELRASFVDDTFAQTLSETDLNRTKTNKWIGSVTVVGPFPAPSHHERVLVCDPTSGAACVRKILSTLARRAYRRPVTDAEVAALTGFVDLARSDGQSVEAGLALAIQALLVSPHFLFHVEHDPDPSDATQVHRISDIELASRTSYFLWRSMPDEELLKLAERGELGKPSVLEAQVRRMLADPKASALAESFAGQWLEIRNLDGLHPDPARFPEWGPELRDAMRTETQLFFDWILRQNRPIGDFIDARYTFLNELLAKYYGIAGVSGSDFRRVALTTDQRGGVLSQASVLAVSSYPTRTSVVLRGKYVLQNILGSPPPPPPPDVPALDESAVGTTQSLRQQMEAHRSSPACAACHARMDPLGFGLENYDAIGHWRSQDGAFPVDASGVLPDGHSFSSPTELRRILRSKLPDFARCLTRKMLIYALGRGLGSSDAATVQTITEHLAASGYRMQTLIREIVESNPFRSRRAETPAATTAAVEPAAPAEVTPHPAFATALTGPAASAQR
jgi:mono/diheme cytochrome c family protein